MPHATRMSDVTNDEDDDSLIDRVLNSGDPQDLQNGLDPQRDLEPGEKADDAVDFGDLSDDDLADDEDVGDSRVFSHEHLRSHGNTADELEALTQNRDFSTFAKGIDVEEDGMDDLFGDTPSSPLSINDRTEYMEDDLQDPDVIFSDNYQMRSAISPALPLESRKQLSSQQRLSDSKDGSLSREQQLQMELFQMSRPGQDALPAPPANQEELLASLWPKFKHDTVPRFIDLLPPKRARYVGKTIPKLPRPLNPTNITLELAQDGEKSFRTGLSSKTKSYDDRQQSLQVLIEQDTADESLSEDQVETDSDFENTAVGGTSWQDLQTVCEDWDTASAAYSSENERLEHYRSTNARNDARSDLDHRLDNVLEWPDAKRRRLSSQSAYLTATPHFSLCSALEPEHATSEIARKVFLDLNDPKLLIDHIRPAASTGNGYKRSTHVRNGHGAFIATIGQRYNISNDDAYDMLKENHQSKVRSMLGNAAVEHSLPAVRLQWPFYKTKLDKHDARAFHRPILKVKRDESIVFGKLRFSKRKHLKGKASQSIYQSSKDLSFGDNSNVLLLEYSEEYPTMLSNVGMGNRIINYYRRKTIEDLSRPKLDIGETAVLLPQDKSPFSIFGHVDPGEATPALYNSMFRAPIFKQAVKSSDFLIIRNTTGLEGSSWSLRNIENIYTVGQEFPSVDVPGPHSRKVTTASKNRLKMVSYRLIRRKKTHRINVSEVTNHFADTTDMQNRQKMKEFMQFNKEHKEWQMRHGESVPGEETVRSMVKPEDVCLLESMQVGQQHLQDAGFSKEDDNPEVDEAREGQSIEQQLAPWYTSRNFLHATQGKAMLALHGEGDPSGRGEAFSFIKTSMKGGFKAAEASATEKMRAKQMRDSNGHAYNVQEQQKSYEQSIRRIWETQKQSLSSVHEQTGSDIDEDPVEEATVKALRAGTPQSETQTSTTLRRRDDETISQYTQHSTGSQAGRTLKISRYTRDDTGNLIMKTDTIRDPKVIGQYLKRRNQKEEETLGISDLMNPTGDPEKDKRREQLLQKELFRLQKNKERRLAREKGKVHFDSATDEAGSPSTSALGVAKAAGTQRKCANCGQVGHIKTNKKLCPMLNGMMKPEEGFNNAAFTMGTPAT